MTTTDDAAVLSALPSGRGNDQNNHKNMSVGSTHGLAFVIMICMVILRYLTVGRGPFSIFTAVAACMVTLVFVYFYPFGRTAQTALPPRLSAVFMVLAGLVSSMVALTPPVWLRIMGIAAAIMVIAAFLVELLRKERRHLIASLSTTLMSGAMGFLASGWGVFPSPRGLGSFWSVHPLFSFCATLLAAVLLIAVMGVSALWVKDENHQLHDRTQRSTDRSAPAQAQPSARTSRRAEPYAWVGLAMIPVMICGLIPLFLAAAQSLL
ncbi:hypothetical protein [Scardovia inopinata]|uniref:hypothetical protein n=1 Tax=Scardovia inopinata TaxID=78259 RepID=UPI0011876F02|nr:hypothetical protein [Scardovia inopinata]